MTSRTRTTVAAGLFSAVVLVTSACGDGTTTTTSDGGPEKIYGVQRAEPLDVSDVQLPDVTGNPAEPTSFTMKAPEGELLIAYFGYTFCPDVCPTSLSALRRAYSTIGAERTGKLQTAMITVDPRRDTAVVLSTYLSGFFDERYHALRTMDMRLLKETEDAFLASSDITYAADGTPEVSHTGTTYAVDSDGKVVIEWAFGTNSKEIASDLDHLFDQMEEAPT